MAWYHWIAVWMVIIGAGLLTILPEKTFPMFFGFIGMIVAGVWMIRNLPPKEDGDF